MEELGAGAPRGPGAGRGRREGRGQGGEDKRPLRGRWIWLYLQPQHFFYFLFFYGGLVSFPRLSRAACTPAAWTPGFGQGGAGQALHRLFRGCHIPREMGAQRKRGGPWRPHFLTQPVEGQDEGKAEGSS